MAQILAGWQAAVLVALPAMSKETTWKALMTAETAREYIDVMYKDAVTKLHYSAPVIKDNKMLDAYLVLCTTAALCETILDIWDRPCPKIDIIPLKPKGHHRT